MNPGPLAQQATNEPSHIRPISHHNSWEVIQHTFLSDSPLKMKTHGRQEHFYKDGLGSSTDNQNVV